jgi:hypothetical protein
MNKNSRKNYNDNSTTNLIAMSMEDVVVTKLL